MTLRHEVQLDPVAPERPLPSGAADAGVLALRVAGRLPLSARANAQGSISVIAGFSFLGIVLGVAALIVVMAVMNGFRHDLMDKMIGLNGHMFLQGVETPLTDYDAVTARVSKVPGVTLALPLVEGQAFASSPYGSSGALVRGIRGPISSACRASRATSFRARSTVSTPVRAWRSAPSLPNI